MSNEELTIENICAACGKGPCETPCDKWYALLSGEKITPEDLKNEKLSRRIMGVLLKVVAPLM